MNLKENTDTHAHTHELFFSCSVISDCDPTALQASLSFTISWSLLKLMFIESVMPTIISSSFVPFPCPQFFSASGSFPVSQLFASGGQSIGASASASVLPKNIQGWFPLRLTWFDLLSAQGTLKSLLQFKSINSSLLSLLYGPTHTSVHDYWKNHSFDYMDFCLQSDVSAFKYVV